MNSDLSRELQILSRLFTYPEKPPGPEDLDWLEGGDFVSEDLTELQAEYVRLFINALPEVPCPPYGSFYLEGTLMGQSTVDMNKLYLSHGFEPVEMADHVAVELEFLAYLARLSVEDSGRDDFELLFDHVRGWAAEFLDRLDEHSRLGFYKAVSKRTRRIILDSNQPGKM